MGTRKEGSDSEGAETFLKRRTEEEKKRSREEEFWKSHAQGPMISRRVPECQWPQALDPQKGPGQSMAKGPWSREESWRPHSQGPMIPGSILGDQRVGGVAQSIHLPLYWLD